MDAQLATTPLHDWHRAHGGRMVDFAGWSMPVQYTSITEEHTATRERATLFDVSHMGRFLIQGAAATGWLDGCLTRRITDLEPGRIRYSLVTRDDAGILDDVLVYRLTDLAGDSYLQLVVNASNRAKIWDWLQPRLAAGVELTDVTCETAMIAVQGPLAVKLAEESLSLDGLSSLGNYTGECRAVDGQTWTISRTGYTGEDGVELIVPADCAVRVWERLLELGASQRVQAAGLGARDTLRLEAAMPLYGHELDETINPYQAGLAFAVNLAGRDFPGADVLRAVDRDQLARRVGLVLAGKRVARQPDVLYNSAGEQVGAITSGTFSPTLQQAIAMAYVTPAHAELGQQLEVEIRGRREVATVVKLPFYQRG
ncbi:MAG: glycine cleavage system aminomethyltransferase GcvT [Planctomycetales bacterium]|nr:glycine cleavage system aminomethyltransferase GcvT [Planctomycetales bacterium]